MSERKLASAPQRRGDLANPKFLEEIYSHLEKDKKGKWRVKPFQAIIRSNRTNSKKPRNVPTVINNFDALADLYDFTTNTLTSKENGLLFNEFEIWYNSAKGTDRKLQTLADKSAGEYQKTHCYRLLMSYYTGKGTKPISDTGQAVVNYGQYLYMKFGRDPALFTLDDFRAAKTAPEALDANGETKISDLGGIRKVMQFAAMKLEGSPLFKSNFQLQKYDEWYTAGKKNVGGKKHEFLTEQELIRFVSNIQEIDTLVLHRLTFEGMTRLSSAVLMGKSNVDKKGYNCVMLDDPLFACNMFEPKIKKSKTSGKVTRYFLPSTIQFFKDYLEENGEKGEPILGAWFQRAQHSYAASLKAAGHRAGLWRFKTAAKGDKLADGEKLDLSQMPYKNGKYLVYTLKGQKRSKTGKITYSKVPSTEGKLTTSHIVGKHTGISIAGLHGFTLDHCAEQAGTDPSTVRDFYHGTLGMGLQNMILGKANVDPWHKWHPRVIEPLYRQQYNKLKREQKPKDAELKRIQQEEQALNLLGGSD